MCMTSLAARFFELRPLIDQQTQEDLSALLVQIGSGEASSDFLDSAFGAIRSGKRFRALLAHFGAALVSGKELGQAPVAHLGAALELYQASALAHDDVIDHADTRRGAPTPHIRLATIHRERQWLGSDEQFGAAAAIPSFGLSIGASATLITYLVLTLVLSLLMVSELPMFSFKLSKEPLSHKWPQLVLIVVAIGSVVWLGWFGCSVTIIAYLLLSLLPQQKGEKA